MSPLNLYDDSGLLLEQQTIHLDGGKWELVEWDIEAWKTGDITVTVTLENYSESESLTIEDVEEFESSQASICWRPRIDRYSIDYDHWRLCLCLRTESEGIRTIYQTSP